MRLRLAIAVLAAAALVALVGAGSAGAAKRMEIAVMDDPVFVDGAYYDREEALGQARALGVTRIRANLSWWDAVVLDQRGLTSTPKRVRYDWSKYDSLIDAAARYGIRIQLTLTGPAPAFANTDNRIGEYGPDSRRYSQFVRDAVRHFKGRVNRYSLWNEPNHIGWIQPLDLSAALYRELYTAGYKAAKRADRRAQVLLGELVPYGSRHAQGPLSFLRDMSCSRIVALGTLHRRPGILPGPCPALRTDGVAVHPYDYRRSPSRPYPATDSATVGSLGYLTGELRELNRIGALRGPHGRPAPVYMTEFGYFNSGKYRIPQSRRSKYLVRAYRRLQRDPLVREVLQYSFVTPPRGFTGGYFDLSLIDPLGRPMPPYTALQRWVRTAQRRGQVLRAPRALKLPPARST